MRPYSKINIGDIYSSPISLSNMKYTVVDKADGMIEVRSSYQHPMLPETTWMKPTNRIFMYPYFINDNTASTGGERK